MSAGVTVLGSANWDLVLTVDRLPQPGQTVLSGGRTAGAGGKGLNQAVAARRAGSRTRFVTALGNDAEGAALRRLLDEEDVEATLRVAPGPTGLAVVVVDRAGENAIVVLPGANAELSELRPAELAAVRASAVLLLQLEVPVPTVTTAAQAARDAGVLVVLNAAPAAALPDELLGAVDLLVVNEGEARALLPPDAAPAPEALLTGLLGRVPNAVITLGATGAVQRGRDGSAHREPGLPVTARDTTGAGDTFCGYLTAALADGRSVPEAMQRACAAAALSVQRAGAVPSIPSHAEVDALRGGSPPVG